MLSKQLGDDSDNSPILQVSKQLAADKSMTKLDAYETFRNDDGLRQAAIDSLYKKVESATNKNPNYMDTPAGQADYQTLQGLSTPEGWQAVVDKAFDKTRSSYANEQSAAAQKAARPVLSLDQVKGLIAQGVMGGKLTPEDGQKIMGLIDPQKQGPLEKTNEGGVPILRPREQAAGKQAWVDPTLRSVAPGGAVVDSSGRAVYTNPNRPSSTTVNVGGPESVVASGQKKATEKYGESLGTRIDKRYQQAEEADRQNVQLDQVALALSRGAKTGAGQEAILTARRYLKTAGIDVGNLSDQELIQKISNEMALRLRNPESGLGLTGNTSNKDLEFLRNSVVGLNRTEEGNRVIIEAMRQYNRLRKDVAIRQGQIIEANDGVVPLNIEQQLMEYVNEYQLFTPSERSQIEGFMKGGKATTQSGGTPTGRRPLPKF
jgi:hypothetical protein